MPAARIPKTARLPPEGAAPDDRRRKDDAGLDEHLPQRDVEHRAPGAHVSQPVGRVLQQQRVDTVVQAAERRVGLDLDLRLEIAAAPRDASHASS